MEGDNHKSKVQYLDGLVDPRLEELDTSLYARQLEKGSLECLKNGVKQIGKPRKEGEPDYLALTRDNFYQLLFLKIRFPEDRIIDESLSKVVFEGLRLLPFEKYKDVFYIKETVN